MPIRHQRLAFNGSFSKDGKLVITGGHDGAVKITKVPLQTGAVIPGKRQLEQQLGSRLTRRKGQMVCETIPMDGTAAARSSRIKKG